jgi:hypothetical protein
MSVLQDKSYDAKGMCQLVKINDDHVIKTPYNENGILEQNLFWEFYDIFPDMMAKSTKCNGGIKQERLKYVPEPSTLDVKTLVLKCGRVRWDFKTETHVPDPSGQIIKMTFEKDGSPFKLEKTPDGKLQWWYMEITSVPDGQTQNTSWESIIDFEETFSFTHNFSDFCPSRNENTCQVKLWILNHDTSKKKQKPFAQWEPFIFKSDGTGLPVELDCKLDS